MANARFFTKTFYLDNKFSRSSANGESDNWIRSPIKAFAVVGTNNSGFQADIVPDPDGGHVNGIPLYDGFYQNFQNKPSQVLIENKTAQPGVWIKILFSLNDELNLGAIKSASKNFVIPYEGTSVTMLKRTVTAVVAELIPANELRTIAVIQHKSGTSIWVGSPVDLAEADYQNICFEIKAGENFIWKNSASLNAKTASGSTIFSLTQEFV